MTCKLAAERLQQAQATQKEIARLQEDVGRLEHEWRTCTGADEAQAARKRARLRADGESTQMRIDGLVRRQAELSQEARTIDEDHQSLLMRYQRKSDELAAVGEEGRAEIETELADLLVQRYLYERDAKLLERANGLRAAILERAGETLIHEAWVTTPEGKIVPESKLAEHGGVGVTFVGKGSRVSKEWAKRHGVI